MDSIVAGMIAATGALCGFRTSLVGLMVVSAGVLVMVGGVTFAAGLGPWATLEQIALSLVILQASYLATIGGRAFAARWWKTRRSSRQSRESFKNAVDHDGSQR